MKFDKIKSISKNNNVKIYLDEVETDQPMMIDEEYIFLDNIKTTRDVVITKKTIVLGDIECNFLNVLAELICYGNIKANTIFTTINIECYKDASYDNLMSGSIKTLKNSCEKEIVEKEVIKEVEKVVEVVKEVNPFENLKIDLENIDLPLSIVDEFKDKIIEYADAELIFLDEDTFINELEKIGLTFLEFKNDSQFLKKMKKYSQLDEIRTLKQYIDFLKLTKNTPSWLEEIDIVENTVEKLMIHSIEDLKELEVNLNEREELLDIVSDIVNVKNELNGNYNDLIEFILNKYNKLLIIPNEVNQHYVTEEKEQLVSSIDIKDLYEQYIWKKGSLLECKVKSIKDGYLELLEVNKEENNILSIRMYTNETNKYTVGQTVLGCILKISIDDEKLNIEVVNDTDNMPRLIFKYLCSKHGLTNSIIQNFSRIKYKSSCIVIALPSSMVQRDNIITACKNIEIEMKKYLNGEEVNIFIFDKDPEKFAANILGVKQSNIKINESIGKCLIYDLYIPDENRIHTLLNIQGENLKKVFKYKIEIEYKSMSI